jgi:Ca2+-binding RTX toxin-like protein
MLVFNPADDLILSRNNSGAIVNLARGFFQIGNRRQTLTRFINYVVGTRFDDNLTGSNQGETISGGPGSGRDVINGLGGIDVLLGFGGRDIISGGSGNDLIAGSDGRDVLTGGPGADSFFYTNSTQGRDRITDFQSSEGDTILIGAREFGGGLTDGLLDADQFVLGSAAGDRNDRFIYDRQRGILFFDVDGSGSRDAVAIAKFDNRPRLSASDFTLI